jgi:hypothetical protein
MAHLRAPGAGLVELRLADPEAFARIANHAERGRGVAALFRRPVAAQLEELEDGATSRDGLVASIDQPDRKPIPTHR